MSIKDYMGKIKSFAARGQSQAIYFTILIILVATSSFGLGRLSKISENKEPIRVLYPEGGLPANALNSEPYSGFKEGTSGSNKASGAYVASKRGKRYYPADCSAAKSLKEENKIFFSTETEAQKAGYTTSSSC